MTEQRNEISAVELYKRLLRYAKPYWRAFIAVIVAMVIYSATEAGVAMIMKPLMDQGFVGRDPDVIKLLPLGIIGLFIIRGLSDFFTTYGLGWIARNVIKTLREQMFNKLLTLPAAFYDHSTSGQLMAKLLYDVEQVASAATDAALTIIRDSLTIIGLLAWMLYLSGYLSLLILFTVPFIAVLVYFVSVRFRRISKNIQNSMGDVSHVSGEIIEGHREVKTFGGQAYETERFEKVNQGNRRQQMKKIATDAVAQPLTALIAALGMALVIFIATLPQMETITVGDFTSFVTAMMMLLTPMKRLTKVNSKLQAGIAAADSIFHLLDEKPERDDGKLTMDRAKGHIEYRKLSFSYGTGQAKVLDDISFEAHPGQTVAFVGHSGSGKTTLVSLLARFYNIDQGQILIDGIDINQLKLADLRRQMSLVNQQVVLFNDTIANNISYGQTGEVSEQQIIDAARSAHAWDFIQRLPDGLQTQVGENGVLLSGGQRQRLAIARALLRDAPILILDEATSALDTEAERHIQAALETLMQQRTTLVIAHRLSTIENADLIVVMHNGEILETGTHAELMAKGDHYAELHRLQFQES